MTKLNSQQQEYVGRATKTQQIIVGALVMGVLFFAGVVLVRQGDQAADDTQNATVLIAAGAAFMALVAAFVIPRILSEKMRQSIATGNFIQATSAEPVRAELGDVQSIMASLSTTTIVGAAILEGSAFHNLITYMLQQQTLNLACATMLLIALFFKFPTRHAVEDRVDNELKLVEEIRSLQR